MNTPPLTALREQKEHVLQSFDFERVLSVMNFLGWTWSGCPVLTVEDLRRQAERLLDECINRYAVNPEDFYVGTGGFYANLCVYKSGRATLSLQFAVESVG